MDHLVLGNFVLAFILIHKTTSGFRTIFVIKLKTKKPCERTCKEDYICSEILALHFITITDLKVVLRRENSKNYSGNVLGKLFSTISDKPFVKRNQ